VNEPQVAIRAATIDDVAAIVSMNTLLFREDAGQRDPFMDLDWPKKEGEEYFRSLLSRPNTRCFIAEYGGEAVGYLIGFVRERDTLRPIVIAELQSMYVNRRHRDHGIGARLAQEFFAWCAERGVERVSVTAYASNDGAIRFYRRMGFQDKELTLEHGL
jgi:ribosomal protein S18 acetylase RimI-like enzyme